MTMVLKWKRLNPDVIVGAFASNIYCKLAKYFRRVDWLPKGFVSLAVVL